MKPFALRKTPDSWVIPVSAMCAVLGFMIALAWVTKENQSTRSTFLEGDQNRRVAELAMDIQGVEDLSLEVKKLQADKTRLEKTLGDRGNESKVLNSSLQEAKLFAGLTDVQGPGVRITLRDSSKGQGMGGDMAEGIVHDLDVLRVVNELYASGAEAISVNDQRDGGPSSYRCVGPTILVNDVKIASPVVIRAIGDPATLSGGMNLPGGILEGFREFDNSMVQIESMKTLRLPAFVGSTSRRFAQVPKAAK